MRGSPAPPPPSPPPPPRRRLAPRPRTPVENSSDSVTQWRDGAGDLYEQATEPNSLLAVLAEAWDHRVTPARRGSRAIIKFAMTTSSVQLPAFRANLEREAYAA
jgi:hypothetical protein